MNWRVGEAPLRLAAGPPLEFHGAFVVVTRAQRSAIAPYQTQFLRGWRHYAVRTLHQETPSHDPSRSE
jgi:hypothetical protein